MSTQTTPAADAPKTKRLKFILALVDGANGRVECRAEERKDGSFSSYARHRVKDAEGKTDPEQSKGRGAVEKHETFEAAKDAAKKLQAQFVKLGWSPKASGGTSKSNVDFSTLPKPKTVKK